MTCYNVCKPLVEFGRVTTSNLSTFNKCTSDTHKHQIKAPI